jgi:hypothetical protein
MEIKKFFLFPNNRACPVTGEDADAVHAGSHKVVAEFRAFSDDGAQVRREAFRATKELFDSSLKMGNTHKKKKNLALGG